MFDGLRSRLFVMLAGHPEGVPPWVASLETGDDEGFFGPGSAVWTVHGDISVLVAGMRALLLQTLHPGAMAGVHEWSRYREDPLGRLNGTVRWVLMTSFGTRAQSEQACAMVGRLHERVRGSYVGVDGPVEYSASDAHLASWVHVAFADSFLRCQQTWGRPIPDAPGETGPDRYVREWSIAGRMMGVENPPTSEAELDAQLAAFDPELRSDDLVRDAVKFLRKPPLDRSTGLGYRIIFAAAVATLPRKYRAMLGVRRVWWPAIGLTRVLLSFVARLLGRPSTSEKYARRRVARLEAARA